MIGYYRILSPFLPERAEKRVPEERKTDDKHSIKPIFDVE